MTGSKIVLAVDLDDTVFRYVDGLKEYLRDNHHYVKRFRQPTSYDLAESGWFTSYEEFKKLHGEAVEAGLFTELKLMKDSRRVLRDLQKNGYEINVVTSRFVNHGQHQKVVTQTAQALDDRFIPYDNILFLSDKTRFLADAYIDDAPHNIESLTRAGRTVIAFNQPYNINTPTHYRVDNWCELRETLKKMFGR